MDKSLTTVMTTEDFLLGLRTIFPYPRTPTNKSFIYKAMLAYDSAPMWRKYVASQEMRQDLSIFYKAKNHQTISEQNDR